MYKQFASTRLVRLQTAFERLLNPAGLVGPRINERGQGTTEFGTIIAILVLIVVAAMALFREALLGLFQSLAGRMGGF
jgi:Flp pilus assembly pilin Flp